MIRVNANKKPILRTDKLAIGYLQNNGRKELKSDLNLQICPGELVCLIGPNGSGKSTLMRTMAGLQPALAGQTLINDIAVKNRSFKQMSRLMSLVLTDTFSVGNLTVFQVVSLGRYPHNNIFGSLTKKDKQIIFDALNQVHMTDYASRYISELSDGEKQRALIAKALAQDTPLILLDEPTAHLDLPNRVDIMQLLRKLAGETEKAILLSTHELDLALQAADRIWLMNKQSELLTGTPEDLVLNGDFERAFGSKQFNFDLESGSFQMNHKSSNTQISIAKDNVQNIWLRRALLREGYQIAPTADLKVSYDNEQQSWLLNYCNQQELYPNIAELLDVIRHLTAKE